MCERLLKPTSSRIIDRETFELEKHKWDAEMKICKAELEEPRAKLEERDRKREAERNYLPDVVLILRSFPECVALSVGRPLI